MKERNRQVKDYFTSYFCEEPNYIQQALNRANKTGLKPIHISPYVATMVYMLAKMAKPKKILEIGALGGYSALWLSRALEAEGKLITLEYEPDHVEVAKKNIYHAGKEGQIEVRQGDALYLMEEMIEKKEGPFDLIFLDAAKGSYPEYLEPMLALSRTETIWICDNLLPKRGEVGVPDPRDAEAVAVYTFNQMLADHPQLETVPFITLVGDEGKLDALGVSIVKYMKEGNWSTS